MEMVSLYCSCMVLLWTGESWKKTSLYDDLLKAGFKVITLDLRGNGKSDKPHDPGMHMQKMPKQRI